MAHTTNLLKTEMADDIVAWREEDMARPAVSLAKGGPWEELGRLAIEGQGPGSTATWCSQAICCA
jgi:hypothetical protein